MFKRLLSLLLVLALMLPVLSVIPANAAVTNVADHKPIYIGDAAVDYGAELILSEIPTDGLSDMEKIRAVYDWVIRNCKREGTASTVYYSTSACSAQISAYAAKMDAAVSSGAATCRTELATELCTASVSASDARLDSNWMLAYMAEYMMTYRIGDCLHYSALLAVLLNHLGFDCRIIGGDYINSDGSLAMHKWNCVLVDGDYYWLDVRMDHYLYTTYGKMYYRYFMISDLSNWEARHSWDHTYSDWLFANSSSIQSYVSPHEHSWDSGTLTTPMTDTRDGVVTYTCTGCGESYTVTLPAGGSPYIDVQNSSAFYYEPVLWATEKGITNGVSNFAFAPTAGCTRGQMVTFLWRLAGEPEPAISSCAFTDIRQDQYYYKAVLWAVGNGITDGVSPTSFAPTDPVTRGQAVTFLWRAAGKPSSGISLADCSFRDLTAGRYYEQAVLWAVENGITNGTTATTFSPEVQVSRAQAVTFLYRYAALA